MEKKNLIILAVALLFLVIGGTTIVMVSHNKKQAEKIEEKKDGKSEEQKEKEKKEKEKEQKEQKEKDEKLPKLPDLKGMTVEEATNKLNSENIDSDFTIKREDSDLKKGVIVRTEPEAGSTLPTEEKLQIVFYLSNGNKAFTVEDYEGKDYKTVKKALEEKGVVVTIKRQDPSYERTDVPEDMVIGQSVEAGKELKSGGSITLYVARVNAKYPNFTDGNYTLEDVQKYCDENDIKLTVLYDEVTTYDDGKVFYQEGCMPGETVKSGCEMTIKIAKH